MQMKDILNCLPLVASVLSRKYGVNVIVGGDTAFTEGKNIHIPSLPITSDEHLLCMVRGFIDHESAHIRFTDFELLAKEKLDKLAFHIFNIIEDWRVENELAKLFAGSQVNLHYLIRHFFVNKQEEAGEKSPASLLLNYMLLTVRSWDISEIAKPKTAGGKGILQTLRFEIEPVFLGLLDKLDMLFQEIRLQCKGTQGSIYYAKEVLTLLKNYCSEMQEQEEQKKEESGQSNTEQGEAEQKEGNADEAEENTQDSNNNDITGKTKEVSLPPVKELAELLEGKGNALSLDLGTLLAENLSQNCSENRKTATIIAEADSCAVVPMLDFEKKKALSMSVALRARMQGFLQSLIRQESAVGRHGRLYPHNLYRASVHNHKIFCRESLKKGMNTAVHILLDTSGSMDGMPLFIARQACFALGKVLGEIKNVNPAITVFPANSGNKDSVYPLLKHGQKLTDVTVQSARGTTPLAPALWWVLREMLFLKENRKIIFILTDGKPDCYEATRDVLAKAEMLGFEVYGIGIKDRSIEEILPKTSAVIMNLEELVPSVFAMLQKALLKS